MHFPNFDVHVSGVFQHILSFFHSPSNFLLNHRDDSYNRWTQNLPNQTLNTKADIQKYSDCPYVLRHYLKATNSWYEYPLWKTQKFFALAAVQSASYFFFQLSPTLQNDRDIIKEACKQFPHLLESVDPKYANDIRIVVPNSNCRYENRLQYASARLRDDKQAVLLMVYNYGRNLQCASSRLRNNYEIVEAAVINDASAIEFASEKMKDDYHIMSIVITCRPLLIKFASQRLKNDSQLVNLLYNLLSEELKQNKQFILELIPFCVKIFPLLSPKLRKDYEIKSAVADAKRINTSALCTKKDLELICRT